MHHYSDNEIVALIRDGSMEAYGELYSRYRSRLMLFCRRFVKDDATAEDVVHDVFLHLWQVRAGLNPEQSISGYLHKLTQNHVLNMFRRADVHSRFVRAMLSQASELDHTTEDEIAAHDYAAIIKQALQNLSPRQREVFVMSRQFGLSYKDIAERLNISVDVVQEHASAALKKIRLYLARHADIQFAALITAVLMS